MCLVFLLLFVASSSSLGRKPSPVSVLFNSINGGHPLSLDAVARHAEQVVGDPVRDNKLLYPLFERLDRDGDGLITRQEFAVAFPMSRTSGPIEQVHLSLAGPSGMYVMWVTDMGLTGNASVRWGAGNALNFESNATQSTYSAGWGWNKTIHTGAMKPLRAGQLYSYQVGVGTIWSPVYNFTTPGPSKATIAFLGDQGTVQPLGFAVSEQIAQDCRALGGCDAVHLLGDLSYAWGTIPGPEIESIWDTWATEATIYSAQFPQMCTIGNHEGYANQSAFKARFRMPGIESRGNGNFYWSQDIGPVHVVSFSTDAIPTNKEEQLTWLLQDLDKANGNRANVPWIVATTHHPMYSSDRFAYSNHIPGSGEQRFYEPYFVKYGVDLLLTGHCHVYERCNPLIAGKPVVPAGSSDWFRPNATCHVVQGTGGAFYWDKWTEPQPVWSTIRQIHYGYGLLRANATTLTYEYRVEKDRSLRDSFVIRR